MQRKGRHKARQGKHRQRVAGRQAQAESFIASAAVRQGRGVQVAWAGRQAVAGKGTGKVWWCGRHT